MNTFAVEIFDDTGIHCTFYTVRWQDTDETETDKFFQKFENNKELERPLTELAAFLNQVIANEHGALDDFFRFENAAQAIPPSGKYNVGELHLNFNKFPLRLYCLKLTNQIVILFNGNEKTTQTAQGGNTSMAFHEANQFASKIIEAIKYGTIEITNNQSKLKYYNSSEILL